MEKIYNILSKINKPFHINYVFYALEPDFITKPEIIYNNDTVTVQITDDYIIDSVSGLRVTTTKVGNQTVVLSNPTGDSIVVFLTVSEAPPIPPEPGTWSNIWINGNQWSGGGKIGVSCDLKYTDEYGTYKEETVGAWGWDPIAIKAKIGTNISATITGPSIVSHYDSSLGRVVEDRRYFEGEFTTTVGAGDPDNGDKFLFIQAQL